MNFQKQDSQKKQGPEKLLELQNVTFSPGEIFEFKGNIQYNVRFMPFRHNIIFLSVKPFKL